MQDLSTKAAGKPERGYTFIKKYETTDMVDEHNIVALERDVAEALAEISDSLKKTLGPYGSHTIIESKIKQHVMTKDGYQVLKAMNFTDPIKATVHDYVRKLSLKWFVR